MAKRKVDFPKDSRKTFKKLNRNEKNIKKEAYKIFDNKYYNNKSKPIEKVDMSRPFTNGKIYTFDYNPINKKILPFYDTKPIILSLGGVKKDKGFLEYGLNLSYIPPKYKDFIIDTIFKVGKRLIDKDFNYILDNNKSKVKSLGITKKQIESLFSNTGYEFAIRSYYRHRLTNMNTIFYDDWYLLSWVQSKSVRKTTISNIQRLYQLKKSRS